MTTINQESERLNVMVHDMAAELVRQAKSAGCTHQQIINALSTRLITLGYEKSGSTQAVAEWFRQVGDKCQGGNIEILLEFGSIANGEKH